jgi:fibronectin-binding autotransporter adhesin
MPPLLRRAIALGAVVAFLLGHQAQAQTTYTWNYSGTDWSTAANWSPNGVPTAADTALLTTFDALTYNLPAFAADAAVGELDILGPRWGVATQFTGNGHALTVGQNATLSTAPLTYRGGFGTALVFNNLTVSVATGSTFATGYSHTIGAVELSGFSARMILTNGSLLNLTNSGADYDLTINGGAQVQLNNGSQINNGTTGVIRFHGSGILNLLGTSGAASTFNLNQIVAGSGHATIGVPVSSTTGSSVRLNLGSASQSGVRQFTPEGGLGTGTIEFNFTRIPGFTGAQGHVFSAVSVPTVNGVIVPNIGSTSNSPYVILTGSISSTSGSSFGRFATYNSGSGEITAQLGTTRDETGFSSVAANENVIYKPTSSSANATLTTNISPQTIVFEPVGTGQSVNLGGNTVTTHGIIVERPGTGTTGNFTFSLDAGSIADLSSSHQNVYVLGGGNTFFNVSATFDNSSGALVKSGTGTMVLTGNSTQMNALDIYINQGAIRARIDGANANFGTTNVLHLRGGVLEVDCNAGTSTFSRALGRNFDQVNWNFGTSTTIDDRGSGGFAAVNGNLNVNIGGAAQTLVWNGTAGNNLFFVRSGQYLQFGSLQSTGIVTLQNNLALDDGSAGLPHDSRTIVAYTQQQSLLGFFDPNGRSVISGVVSGSAATSLMKSGPGTLELTAANTYAGGTAVELGALMVSNISGSATGTGNVVIRDTLLGNGTIAPSSGNGVTVMPSGIIYTMREFVTPGNPKIGADGVNNPVLFRANSNLFALLGGTTFDPNGGSSSYGRLSVRGTGSITVDGANLKVGLNAGFTPLASDVFGILDNQTSNPITGLFAGIAQNGTVNAINPDNSVAGTFQVSYDGDISGSSISIHGGNDIVLYNFTPVPEPLSVLAVGAAALGLFGSKRRAARHA